MPSSRTSTTLPHDNAHEIPPGVWPVLYAFFNATGQLDREAMRAQTLAVLRAGAPGVVVLGLTTEVQRLSTDEQRLVMMWALEDLQGHVPLAVTIGSQPVAQQVALAQNAQALGASYLLLQPALVQEATASTTAPPRSEDFLTSAFATVMQSVSIPVGIQNAPQFLGVGIGTDKIVQLARAHPNFRWLKGESSAVGIAETIAALQQHALNLPVFNGRGGLELPDNLAAGCRGFIVATDAFDHLTSIMQAHQAGNATLAQQQYQQILPAIVFVMQSIDHLTCYGKRIAAWRLGLEVAHDRGPAPTAFGLQCARNYVQMLGAFARGDKKGCHQTASTSVA